MACKDKKNLKPGYKFRKVYTVSAGDWQSDAYVYSVSMGCNHCADPACLKVCPVAAITKRASDGIVFINKYACIGCGSCAAACPYDVPSLDLSLASPKSDKCDFCRELLAIGESPVCVAACSMNALDYGDIDQLKSKYPGTVRQVFPIADPAETQPSLLITKHRKYTGAESAGSALVVNMPEELQTYEA
jgi:anaerobic dimethyl sulfoxide reductase subunit B (iron-sulfur subunit)